jgi:polyisoprenoid-binding protein YceI
MNQKAIYIILGLVVLILLVLFVVRMGDKQTDDVATTTVATTTGSTSTSVSGGSNANGTNAIQAPLPDGEYTLSTEESVIGWTGRKPRVLGYEDTGTLKLKSGELKVSGGVITSGQFFIDMESLAVTTTGRDSATTTYGEQLRKHLRSSDFFDVEAYNNASFVITSIANGVVTGDLTIKNKTNSISFPAKVTSVSPTRLETTASITLDRAAWEIRYGSDSFFDNLGDNLIADEVAITLDLVAVQ